MFEFVEADAEDVAVDSGDGADGPFGSEGGEVFIELFGFFDYPTREGVDEFGVAEGLFVGEDVFCDDVVNVG